MCIPEGILLANDIRALADTELTDDTVTSLGHALGAYLRSRDERRVIICRDVRASSPRIAAALASALEQSGMHVLDIGIHPTPVCYFAQYHLNVGASVMITASHNPAQYNGMKITCAQGTLHGARLREAMHHSPEGFSAPGHTERMSGIDDAYLADITGRIRLNRPLRVAVDAGNGVAGSIALRLCRALGCETVPLYCEPDPRFPHHHPDPMVDANMDDLRGTVRAHRCDIGIGFDGDGDRLGVVDERGDIIRADLLQILFLREILPLYPNSPVLIEVKCSQALWDEARKLGGKPFFHRTGHAYIKATMHQMDLPFAGEMSGHYFFAHEYYGYDDALYAAARLLRLLAARHEPLSSLLSDVPKYFATPEMRIGIPCEAGEHMMENVIRFFAQKEYQVNKTDGVRVTFSNGWGLLRLSGTQPVIVMRAEGSSQEAMDAIVCVLREAARQSFGS